MMVRTRGSLDNLVEITQDYIMVHGHRIDRVSLPEFKPPVISWTNGGGDDEAAIVNRMVNDDIRVDWSCDVERDIGELAICIVGKSVVYSKYYYDGDLELHREGDGPALVHNFGLEGIVSEWYIHGQLVRSEGDEE